MPSNILADIDYSLSDKIIINLRVGYRSFLRLTPLRKPRQGRHSETGDYCEHHFATRFVARRFFGLALGFSLVLCCGGDLATTSMARSKRDHASE